MKFEGHKAGFMSHDKSEPRSWESGSAQLKPNSMLFGFAVYDIQYYECRFIMKANNS